VTAPSGKQTTPLQPDGKQPVFSHGHQRLNFAVHGH
jgi:hypothetical protein